MIHMATQLVIRSLPRGLIWLAYLQPARYERAARRGAAHRGYAS